MKVLVIITTGLVECGGIANAFMNYYKYIDLSGLTIDVASSGSYDKSMEAIIRKNGGKCFEVPTKQGNMTGYIRAVNNILKQGYDVIDVHGNSATMLVEMVLAKQHGIKNRMAHCLNSRTDHPLMHKLMQPFFNTLCNNKTACTFEAGKHLYGKRNHEILRNAVPLKQYAFDCEARKEIRKQYNISNRQILIGTIGKINEQKNQAFLLPVIRRLAERYANITLMIVGDGPLRGELEKSIEQEGLKDRVILAGMKDYVVPYYSAFDIYVFPSLFEGESLALIEAKCTGIIGCVSKAIKLSNNDAVKNIQYIDLNTEKWVKTLDEQIQSLDSQNREKDSREAIWELRRCGLDSYECAEKLRQLYLKHS